MKTLHVEPELYLPRMLRHLRQNLSTWVRSASPAEVQERAMQMAREVADQVNWARDHAPPHASDADFLERLKAERTTEMIAESDAMVAELSARPFTERGANLLSGRRLTELQCVRTGQ